MYLWYVFFSIFFLPKWIYLGYIYSRLNTPNYSQTPIDHGHTPFCHNQTSLDSPIKWSNTPKPWLDGSLAIVKHLLVYNRYPSLSEVSLGHGKTPLNRIRTPSVITKYHLDKHTVRNKLALLKVEGKSLFKSNIIIIMTSLSSNHALTFPLI